MCNKMSDVRLSNASPTLERVDARQPDNVRPPVRRNLFGSPDPEEVHRYLTASIQENVEAFKEQYNYDPVSDRPLTPRNYEWEKDSDAPEFYSRQPRRRRRPRRPDADSPGDSDNQRDAEESGERRQGRQPDGGGSRKRRSGALGSCSSESPRSKRSHTDGGDDEDELDGGASQAVKVAQERPSRPDNSAEVQ